MVNIFTPVLRPKCALPVLERRNHMPEITLEGGLRITTFAPPPAGFDPLTAGPADLARYGFPARPDDPHHLARYRSVFGQLRHKFKYVVPTFRVNTDRRHGPRARQTGAGTETSTNWSGGVVYAPSGTSFNWVEGDWVVPDIDGPTANQEYYCASWIGIDGDGSGDVCQVGVGSQVYGFGGSKSFYPWWEWFPNYEVQITNLAIGPGDMVTALICTSGAGATTASVSFSNRTTGASTSFSFSAPSGTELVGNCAEWIVEAPTVGGAQSALANTVNGGTGDNINMTAGGNVVSDGNLITPTVIQCLYAGPEP
jgi:Peptidase A4 family